MRVLRLARPCAAALLLLVALVSAYAQELPLSGVTGFDAFYATAPGGTSSQLLSVNVHRSLAPIALAPAVGAVPSRWAHRRRTLGGLETKIALGDRGLFLTPMGDSVGNGAIHMVDLRSGGTAQTALVPTGNPAGYDLAVFEDLDFVFSAEDDGAGNTVLRGFSFGTLGMLTPLNPPSLPLAGSPAAYVNRMGVDESAHFLHVPTATGVHVLAVSASAPNVSIAQFVSSGSAYPATNPARLTAGGQVQWIVGTSTFNASNEPVAAGYLAWDATGMTSSGSFGAVPGQPGKQWVPAIGAEELAVVDDGTDAFAYYLLREPPPGTFFVKPSAIGVVRFLGATAPVADTILMPDEVGEPFSIPAVSGTRVAFESSFGPPFIADPPGGGEKISILYTPLDPLGSGPNGTLGVPDPLGGRISTKGMDRPIWSRDGSRVMAATSHFAGAPNPGVPGLEVLEVPADVPVDEYTGPRTTIPNVPFPDQSIVFPSTFLPRVPGLASSLANLSFFGNVFHHGMASIALAPFGDVGQLQLDVNGFTQPSAVPGFPSIIPPVFLDATGSTEPVPATFGARRTAFNYAADVGLTGLTMSAAIGDEVIVQRTMTNLLATFGLGTAVDAIHVPLPQGWMTTTEILSH